MSKPITIEIEHKSFNFEVKSVDADQGIIKGYLSVFNNIDSQNDRVRPGAFKKTIADGIQRKSNKGKKYLWPLLWMHDPEKPIGGFIDAVEDKTGLLVTAQLDISTNEQGIPLNPLATSVFSGFKQGYIDELSMGYKAIQKSYEQGTGIRDLLEVQNFEGSAVTMLWAANDEAQVTSVKALQLDIKSDFPLADKATPWSKSKAIKDIEKATGGDWSKASKYFFWSDANPTKEADHKFPFVANVGGTMKAVPRAIFNAAARLESAKGVDVDAIKSKMAGYYSKMGMTPPWKDKEKMDIPTLQIKDFADRYREEQIRDWKTTDFQNLTCALQSAIMDIFSIGDEPEADLVNTILNGGDEAGALGFIDALKDYVQKGIDLDVSDYCDENPYFGNVSGYSSYGYMARNDTLEAKAGAVVSQANSDRMSGHVNTLMQAKDMIATVADDISHYVTGSPAYVDSGTDSTLSAQAAGTGKSNIRPSSTPNTDNQPFANTDIDLDALALQIKAALAA